MKLQIPRPAHLRAHRFELSAVDQAHSPHQPTAVTVGWADMKGTAKVAKALLAGLLLAVAAGSTLLGQAVYGAIGEKYSALRREQGPLGPALSDEAAAPHGGRFNRFQSGFIYWHRETGAFAVWGAIGEKWDQLGRVNYGYPITDELTTPDRRGRFNHFRAVHLPDKPEASIYWTPETGAHAVYGAIRSQWASMGWERSALGYPTSDELHDGDARRSNFEQGFIRWTSNGGQVVMARAAGSEGGGFAGTAVNGLEVIADAPNSSGTVPVYADPTFLTPVELCARFLNTPGLNDRLRNSMVDQVRPGLPSGFGIHSETNHQLSSDCRARAELVMRNVNVTVRLYGNRFFARITTPSGVPGGLDPNFAVHYDLTLRTSLILPDSPGGRVTQGPMTLSATNISRPETRSMTGGLVLAVDDLVQFLGGQGFLAAARQGGIAQLPGTDAAVSALNARLDSLRLASPPDTRLDIYPNRNVVVAHATRLPPPTGPR